MTGKNKKIRPPNLRLYTERLERPEVSNAFPLRAPSLAGFGLDPVSRNEYSTDPAFTKAFVASHRVGGWSRRMSLSLTGPRSSGKRLRPDRKSRTKTSRPPLSRCPHQC